MTYFTPIGIVGLFLGIGYSISSIIFGTLFIRQSFKVVEGERLKVIIFVGLFLILYGAARLIHPVIFAFIPLSLYYIGQIVFITGQSILIAALIMIVFYVERVIFRKSRYAFTIALTGFEILYIGVVIITALIGAKAEIFSFILAIIMAVSGLLVLIQYARVAIESTGEVRRNAIFIIIGMLFLAASFLINGFENIIFGPDVLLVFNVCLSVPSLLLFVKGFNLSL